jgi:pyridoxine 5-phosphate synthase
MTNLSVNINKIALLRNSRKGNFPDLFQFARDCEEFGAEGITVHPRPDERHIRYSDVPIIKDLVSTEYNIEGYPGRKFLDLVIENRPDQCTLVPDGPDILTSDQGWDTISNEAFLRDVVAELKEAGIRVSLFVDPVESMVAGAKKVGADRIEFYTGDYASMFNKDKVESIKEHKAAAFEANKLNIGINAGHDLNLDNLKYYKDQISGLLEVSIGHALIRDCLYFGLQNVIQMYLYQLKGATY